MEEFFDQLIDAISRNTPKLLAAAAILIGGWVVARIVSRLVFSVLARTSLNDFARRRLGVDTSGKYGHRVERFVARVTFYSLMIVALVLALDTLQVQTVSQPFRNLITGVGDAVPKILLAVVIVAIAYVIGKVVSFSVTKAVEATQIEKRIRRIEGLGPERARLSKSLGSLAFWSILVIGIIQGLDALEMHSLVEPLQNALNEFATVLPDLFGAFIIIVIGIVIARFLGTIAADLLNDIGFDAFFYKILPTAAPNQDDLEASTDAAPLAAESPSADGVSQGDAVSVDGTEIDGETDDDAQTTGGAVPARVRTPSSVAGQVVVVLITLLVVLQALSIMDLDRLALLLEAFLRNVLPNLAIGGVIVLAGIWAGNWVKNQIDGLTDGREARLLRFLGSLARIGVLVFSVAMALQQVGVAPELIRTAFAILFGALSLALALAFGLGGREVAADIVGTEYERHRQAQSKASGGKASE